MVRDADQEMIGRSRGKLRWIVLDEAHTYSGSAASEMRLLLRRVLDAFGVDIKDVKFACTSATMGDGKDKEKSKNQLRDFIAELTGQKADKIRVITGQRRVPGVDKKKLRRILEEEARKHPGERLPDADKVGKLRGEINSCPGLRLSQIWNKLGMGSMHYTPEKALKLLDLLCQTSVDGVPVLALRGHFFMRTVDGLYACGNPECAVSSNGNISPFGCITTYKSAKCACGHPLFELLQCKNCREFVLSGMEQGAEKSFVPCPPSNQWQDYFSLEKPEDPFDEDGEEGQTDAASSAQRGHCPAEVSLLVPVSRRLPLPDHLAHSCSLAMVSTPCPDHPEGSDVVHIRQVESQAPDARWMELRDNQNIPLCPSCGKSYSRSGRNFQSFRINATFLTPNLAPLFLRECASPEYSWGKYLSFTDSRQGTAVSAKKFNIEVERLQARKQFVAAIREVEENGRLSPQQEEILRTVPESFHGAVREALEAENRKKGSMSLKEFADVIFNEPLFSHIFTGVQDRKENEEGYKQALLRNLIGRHPIGRYSMEGMGLVTLRYPAMDTCHPPLQLEGVCSPDQWKDYLKIIIDFFVRQGNHLQPVTETEKRFVRESNIPTPIAGPDNDSPNIDHWPLARKGQRRQSRMVRLLCAAMGIKSQTELDQNINKVNDVLRAAWKQLTVPNGVLKIVRTDGVGPYAEVRQGEANLAGCAYLDLSLGSESVKVERCKQAWLSPVTGSLVDTLFCGYAPDMYAGEIDQALFDRFRVQDAPIIPELKDPQAIKSSFGASWTVRHHLIFDYPQESYLAAEHSGQLDRGVLKQYTAEFLSKPPKLNVLQCSTTMEMGVDIGDIDLVLLNSVPPSPANYMQRVGRAGRSGQTKALAFSLCNDTPAGHAAFNQPMWALSASSEVSKVQHSEVIIQRHINAWFFRKFITLDCQVDEDGLRVATRIGEFMREDTGRVDSFLSFLERAATDDALKDEFSMVFPTRQYAPDTTITAIRGIRDDFRTEIKSLDEIMLHIPASDNRRRAAVANQAERLRMRNLLQELTERQFLPNAHMPTGVVPFIYMDAEKAAESERLRRHIATLRERLSQPTSPTERDRLRRTLAILRNSHERLFRQTETSREARIALSEYAPGQSVVIDEKNYRSSGLVIRNNFRDHTQQGCLFFCPQCGGVEHGNFESGKQCPHCHTPYHSILGDRPEGQTRTFEAVGFRADTGTRGTRTEEAHREYYQIEPVLLKAAHEPVADSPHLTELYPSEEGAELLYFNAGNGFGFAICPRCGRAALETDLKGPMPEALRQHRRLDAQHLECEAVARDMQRNAVLIARHPTCYTIMAMRWPDCGSLPEEYVTDLGLVLSLGVAVRRALAGFLGIEEDEIDFGTRQEQNRQLLYLYDTAKGGCGYASRLSDPETCQAVLKLALENLQNATCSCQEADGACSACLMDRSTVGFDYLLSKRKAMEWLSAQTLSVTNPPKAVVGYSPHSRYALSGLLTAMERSIREPAVNTLTFVISDGGETRLHQINSGHSPLGRLIRAAIAAGKKVKIKVEYHPEHHTEVLDVLPFVGIKNVFADCEVEFVGDMGPYKTCAMVGYNDYVERYFTSWEDPDAIAANNDWGRSVSPLYIDNTTPRFSHLDIPTLPREIPGLFNGLARTGNAVFPVTALFSQVIAPSIGWNAAANKKADDALRGRNTVVTVSDSYLTSPLANMMVCGLVSELQKRFGFKISEVGIYANSNRRANTLEKEWKEVRTIMRPFASQDEADHFLCTLFQKEVGLWPTIYPQDPAHYRFVRIQTSDFLFEIRPDHGFAGGWYSSSRLADQSPQFTISSKVASEGVLFYLLMQPLPTAFTSEKGNTD